jgi:hypothetical protein
VKLDDEIIDVAQWDAIRVPPQVTRQFEAGPDGLEVIAFGEHHTSDPSDPDGQILPNWWTD